eukprot:1150701-Pelagomonas_calceolata.AAC.2
MEAGVFPGQGRFRRPSTWTALLPAYIPLGEAWAFYVLTLPCASRAMGGSSVDQTLEQPYCMSVSGIWLCQHF